jgi:hypothetical protein
MQEFILILVAIFVLFRIFGRPNIIYFNQHHHGQSPDNKPKANRSKHKNANDDGEYVDYEEIK